jgi:hypothetical protein
LQPHEPTVSAARALLGLPDDADRNAVTRAYWRLARTTHPDRSDAADAAARFASLSAAYRRALEAAPTAEAPPTAPPVVDRTSHRRGPSFAVSIRTPGPVGPTIIVGPTRVDPLPARRPRREP